MIDFPVFPTCHFTMLFAGLGSFLLHKSCKRLDTWTSWHSLFICICFSHHSFLLFGCTRVCIHSVSTSIQLLVPDSDFLATQPFLFLFDFGTFPFPRNALILKHCSFGVLLQGVMQCKLVCAFLYAECKNTVVVCSFCCSTSSRSKVIIKVNILLYNYHLPLLSFAQPTSSTSHLQQQQLYKLGSSSSLRIK